jgi:peptidoglycan/xylan/chitin deacetylase (PgdA/CDA1 family)
MRAADIGRTAPLGESGVRLTFDDGPDPTWTPLVLRRLRRLEALATFFVIAPRAEAYPALIDAMLADGHEVELHCWSHTRHSTLTRDAVEADTDRALASLGRLGIRPRRWRTPWGDTAPWSRAVAAERGLRLTGWTADTHDWRGDDAASMLAAIAPDLEPNAIVLMHDGIGPGARRRACRETVLLLEPLCAAVRDRGWAVGPRSPHGAAT